MKWNLNFLSRLRLAHKLGVLAALATLLAALPFYNYYTAVQNKLTLALSEQQGVKPSRELVELAQVLAEHRGLTNAQLAGNAAAAAQRGARASRVAQILQGFEDDVAVIGAQAVKDKWSNVKATWAGLLRSVEERQGEPQAIFDQHSALIASVLALLEDVVDHYKLSLDPQLATNQLIRAVLISTPQVNEFIGQVRGLGAGLLAAVARAKSDGRDPAQAISAAQRAALAAAVNNLEARWTFVSRGLEQSIAADAAVAGPLRTQIAESGQAIHAVVSSARADVLTPALPTRDATQYFADMTRAIDTHLKLTDQGLAQVKVVVDQGRASLERQVQIVLLQMLVAATLASVAAVLIVLSITRPMGRLQGAIAKLKAGDTAARARLEGTDEVATLARQFDAMVDEREAISTKIQRENEQLNASVLGLLQAVAQLSRKDLTVRVPVTEDVTGPVADALNLLSGETAKVLQKVSDISADVTAASLKVKSQSDTVKSAAEQERVQVEHTAQSLETASQTMSQIATMAQQCNVAAERAIKNTEDALATVTTTVGGINSTRDTIRETEKRIKRLGERSQEISVAVSLISSIAERTHILALNAAMHAASAGEAGRGFAVVADEVQRLAENARQATQQIATLVNNIQVETADTVNTMNSAIAQVVEGSKLAEQAGRQMQITQSTTAELVASVQNIARQSQSQAHASTELLERANLIKQSTQETSKQLTEQTEQTSALVGYARNLLEAVRVFKLSST